MFIIIKKKMILTKNENYLKLFSIIYIRHNVSLNFYIFFAVFKKTVFFFKSKNLRIISRIYIILLDGGGEQSIVCMHVSYENGTKAVTQSTKHHLYFEHNTNELI